MHVPLRGILLTALVAIALAFGLAWWRTANEPHLQVPAETLLYLQVDNPAQLGVALPCALARADDMRVWVVRTPEPKWITQLRGLNAEAQQCVENALRAGGHSGTPRGAHTHYQRSDGSAALLGESELWMGDGAALQKVQQAPLDTSAFARCAEDMHGGACIDARTIGLAGIIELRARGRTEDTVTLEVRASGLGILTRARIAAVAASFGRVGALMDQKFVIEIPLAELRQHFSAWGGAP